MLIYGILKPAESQYARSMADKHGLELIAVGNYNQLADQNIIAVGTEEWLDYMANASGVFTTYFHGLIFSIIFRRPFVVFDKPSKSVKVKDLIGDLCLQDRVLSSDNLTQTLPATIDFHEVYARLNPMVQKSRLFLEDILIQEHQ